MNQLKWIFHPILILIFSIVALGTSLTLYIYWYIEVSTGLKAVVEKFNLDSGQFMESHTWVVILVLSILVGIILMGIFIIFVYNQKTFQLYRLQHNFINNFTHELKTPVTSLKLYLETFIKYELSRDNQLKYINYMIQDVDRLSGNINRILNLARIESKSYGDDFVACDLVYTVERFYKNNIQLFRDCEININNPSNRSFSYRISPSLFEMLLMNLLTNAIKYNESHVPRVDITFEPGKDELRLRFEDNGIGIEKPEIKKIFRKFYQIGNSDNMSARGSGLGLYLVDSIAHIHKGRVKAESKGDGKGSIFTLILPFKNLNS
ncbi:MAG: HAMP domain-containing histidine kinase [Deltaproteobacteria bacterium]|nr:HAMP domain-containing histidine kinase [Deltaproteobacteria bacterium]MBW1728088.1 HAMP domain-containing histidine kinase [Deltaproteobacteria bacterium]MBW2034043.1 HAMP domain-containing histidine kinase [Deltaproteobacteria bacterium]MBW2168445.1 HAMP domain-containing histidine kinase [Deltaproteobacteria bacterium]MBW2358703.1 HAMP domain-containing histidine kinase [Deltaproteobacteria bacterium]